MTAYPDNEQERLAVLRSLNLLDTPAETAYDRMTRILAQVLNCPVATISLVDADRIWLKACWGTDIFEFPRDHAFCAEAILSQHGLIVEDAARDSRFNQSTLVHSTPGIRFYAGVPIMIRPGINVGAVSVCDLKPRGLTEEDLQFLNDIASSAIAQIKARLATGSTPVRRGR